MPRKLSRKGLIKKNWELCRQIKFELVGRRCEICGESRGLQVDHCFSRNDKELFYEITNLTVLCESCHNHKTYRRRAMDLKVYEHVEAREGSNEFNRLRKINETLGAYPDWQYMWFHQEKHEWLTNKLLSLREDTPLPQAPDGHDEEDRC